MHTDSPETSAAVVADDQPSTRLRRRLLGAGLIGLAGSLVPRLAASAGATVPGDTTSDTTAATTTTAPPQRPQAGDIAWLDFSQGLELAASQLYAMALDSGSLTPETQAIVAMVRESHVSYGQALNGLLGRDASNAPRSDLVDSMAEAFGGDLQAFAEAAYQLEDALVATHSKSIGQLLGTDGIELIASILIVEARHSLVFADLAGVTDLDDLIFTAASAFEPEEG